MPPQYSPIHIDQPNQYGVVKFDDAGKAVDMVEKPRHFYPTGPLPASTSTLTMCSTSPPGFGLRARRARDHRYQSPLPRARQAECRQLGRGFAWLDTGTHDALLDAADFVRSIQHRQGLLVGCPEEIAYRMRFISAKQLRDLAATCDKTAYGAYLKRIVDEPDGGEIITCVNSLVEARAKGRETVGVAALQSGR
jgi:glucose-1-phosphate thymidylyltransferase